ncbi:unnamed protein product [Timema podura]|uniref:Serine-threonine/tyrosine-protein kinase catalytic domain-containing protein n=1 Tax=Timema podura TaxID=61482 RepID=A0ABN7NP87_TIMPD|nr:unnamed protein product [Timema podura]
MDVHKSQRRTYTTDNHRMWVGGITVRDVTNENTVRFVGACIECPIVLILTEYSPKGSLKDVLQNDELKLDWNFRMSLIHDVVKILRSLDGRRRSSIFLGSSLKLHRLKRLLLGDTLSEATFLIPHSIVLSCGRDL